MDKKILSRIKDKIKLKLSEIKKANNLQKWNKEDQSIVTEMDIFISDLVRDELKNNKEFSHYCFYSEEENKSLTFPVAILDPIDGTIEFERGSEECALSLALMNNPKIDSKENFAWIYNFNNEKEGMTSSIKQKSEFENINSFEGLVSRTEWDGGLFNSFTNEKIKLIKVGSIAYKLLLLSQAKANFVVSLKPKNVWDIAGGTILLKEKEYNLYSKGKEITNFSEKVYDPPLIWCKKEHISFLNSVFHI